MALIGKLSRVNTNNSNGVVLVHGAWHGKSTYDQVTPYLKAAGVLATAIDLPGAGSHAAIPLSFQNRPLDSAAFAQEPSPNAGVTQDMRTEAVIKEVRSINAETGGKAVILGHSLGGLTMTAVTEAIPDEITAVVYLTAFMLPPGMVAGQFLGHPSMEAAQVSSLLMADPAVVGALRLDVASEDSDFLAKVKDTFFADVSEDQFKAIAVTLHPDEPAQVLGVQSAGTQERMGQVPRFFIACTQDNAIPYIAQLEMIKLMDAAMGNETTVFTMETSHSPFLSAPKDLAEIVKGIVF